MSIAAEIRKAALGPTPRRFGLIWNWLPSNEFVQTIGDWEVAFECCNGFPDYAERGDHATLRTFLLLVACALEDE